MPNNQTAVGVPAASTQTDQAAAILNRAGNVVAIGNQVTADAGRLDVAEAALTDIVPRVAGAEGAIEDLQTAALSLDGRATNLETDIGTLATAATTLAGRVTTAENNIGVLISDMNTVGSIIFYPAYGTMVNGDMQSMYLTADWAFYPGLVALGPMNRVTNPSNRRLTVQDAGIYRIWWTMQLYGNDTAARISAICHLNGLFMGGLSGAVDLPIGEERTITMESIQSMTANSYIDPVIKASVPCYPYVHNMSFGLHRIG